jgi:hypothetical protein
MSSCSDIVQPAKDRRQIPDRSANAMLSLIATEHSTTRYIAGDKKAAPELAV